MSVTTDGPSASAKSGTEGAKKNWTMGCTMADTMVDHPRQPRAQRPIIPVIGQSTIPPRSVQMWLLSLLLGVGLPCLMLAGWAFLAVVDPEALFGDPR